jgi:hypothetical protein
MGALTQIWDNYPDWVLNPTLGHQACFFMQNRLKVELAPVKVTPRQYHLVVPPDAVLGCLSAGDSVPAV